MCQAGDVLVSCYYVNQNLEFYGIPSAQVGYFLSVAFERVCGWQHFMLVM